METINKLGSRFLNIIKNYFIDFVVLIIFFVIGYHFWTTVDFDNIKYIKIAGQNIKVELALTPEDRAQGLSDRSELLGNEGILFVFDYPGKYPFWMKDMNFPIDIIWFSEDMKIVYIKKDARPELFPEIYVPDAEAKYVLEIVSGFSEKNNLRLGDKAKFSY